MDSTTPIQSFISAYAPASNNRTSIFATMINNAVHYHSQPCFSIDGRHVLAQNISLTNDNPSNKLSELNTTTNGNNSYNRSSSQRFNAAISSGCSTLDNSNCQFTPIYVEEDSTQEIKQILNTWNCRKVHQATKSDENASISMSAKTEFKDGGGVNFSPRKNIAQNKLIGNTANSIHSKTTKTEQICSPVFSSGSKYTVFDIPNIESLWTTQYMHSCSEHSTVLTHKGHGEVQQTYFSQQQNISTHSSIDTSLQLDHRMQIHPVPDSMLQQSLHDYLLSVLPNANMPINNASSEEKTNTTFDDYPENKLSMLSNVCHYGKHTENKQKQLENAEQCSLTDANKMDAEKYFNCGLLRNCRLSLHKCKLKKTVLRQVSPKKHRNTIEKHAIKKTRRVRANNRERSRMHGLNDAMDELRRHIPHVGTSCRSTKIDTLRNAANYIRVLQMLLREKNVGNGGFARINDQKRFSRNKHDNCTYNETASKKLYDSNHYRKSYFDERNDYLESKNQYLSYLCETRLRKNENSM